MRTRKTIYTATIAAALSAACVWSIAVMAPVQANQKVYRSVTAADEERAQRLLAQADAEREAGDYTAAIEHYTQVIRIDERVGGYAERAYCRYKLGDYEAAERDANTAIHRRSARELTKAGVAGMAELVRGMSRYQRGEYDAAAEDLKMVRGTRYDTPEVRAVCDEVRAKIEERAAAERAARLEAYMGAAAAIYARVQSADPPERCATMRWADYSSEPVRTDAVPPLSELMGHVFLLTDPYGFHTIPHPENPERADISTMLIRGKPTSGLVHFCVLLPCEWAARIPQYRNNGYRGGLSSGLLSRYPQGPSTCGWLLRRTRADQVIADRSFVAAFLPSTQRELSFSRFGV